MILKEMGIPDHLTCLQRNLYADQEVAVRTRHVTTCYMLLLHVTTTDVQNWERSTSGLYIVTLLT